MSSIKECELNLIYLHGKYCKANGMSSTMAYNETFTSIKDYKTESVIPRNSSCLILLLQIGNGYLAERQHETYWIWTRIIMVGVKQNFQFCFVFAYNVSPESGVANIEIYTHLKISEMYGL